MWCCSSAEAEAEAHAQQGPPSGKGRPKSSSKEKKQPAESPEQAEVGLSQHPDASDVCHHSTFQGL